LLVFFFWPAGQALVQRAAAGRVRHQREWVGLENFKRCSPTPPTWSSFKTTPCSRCWWPAAACRMSLLLAVMADRVVQGHGIYKTLLIWPYAVAPAVAGRAVAVHVRAVDRRRRATALRASAIDWNHLLNGNQAMALIVMAAVWKQISYNFLFFLAGLQSHPQVLIEAAAIDGAGPWRRFWTIVFPLLSPDHLLPAGDQRRLRLLRHLRHRRCRHPGRPGQGHRDPGLQGLLRRLQGMDLGGSAAQSVVLMVIVIA
jgi:sn-glycerol 3-phosphate transport system permease protein